MHSSWPLPMGLVLTIWLIDVPLWPRSVFFSEDNINPGPWEKRVNTRTQGARQLIRKGGWEGCRINSHARSA
ncbi:hypothetical protein BJV77DRAFT_999542 [Russula vinacea]|nr:hypothetical protein BJV77DRAFT_999542 [Russula vinacea]